MLRSQRRLALIVAALVVFVVPLVGCTDEGDQASPGTTTFTVDLPEAVEEVEMPGLTVPPGFVPADTRGVRLAKVPSEPRNTPPTLKVYGGTSSLRGHVNGPDGPVPGATVQLERFVGDQNGSVTVVTGSDGGWSVTNLLGGRYRVRAWQAPQYAVPAGQVIFLAADRGSGEVNLDVEKVEGRALMAALDLTEWTVGGDAKLRALVTDNVVDDNGIVVGEPVDKVSVRVDVAARDLEIVTENPVMTSASGIAIWTLKCRAVGGHEVRLRSGDISTSVVLPVCSAATTTTTTLDVTDVPIGTSFRVPFKGILPAGTYITYNADCETSFEPYGETGWSSSRKTVKGDTIVLKAPARDFRAVDQSKPCEFQRSA